MAKKNKSIDDLMAKLGASLKESPIAAHQRQGKTSKKEANTSAVKKPEAQKTETKPTNPTTPQSHPTQQEIPSVENAIYKVTKKPSYRGWKTSTVGLYPEDYQKAREAMNYIQDQTGENTNLSRVVKIALRALEVGPQLLDINNEIKNKDGRLVSRRQNIIE